MGELTFYFDRCFGKRFPQALEKVTPPFIVEYQNKWFKQNTADDEWLSFVGAKDWIVFSHDRKFHSETIEAAAVSQHGIGCFYLCGANSPSWAKLCHFVRAFPAIERIVREERKPYIYHVQPNNRLARVTLP